MKQKRKWVFISQPDGHESIFPYLFVVCSLMNTIFANSNFPCNEFECLCFAIIVIYRQS